jgi:serine/threonine-protein kinase
VIPELEDIPREPRSRAPARTPPPEDTGPKEPRTPVLSYAVGALGVVGIGMGTFFGIRAVSRKDEADQACSGKLCSADGLRANDQARTAANVSTWSFVAGGAALLGAAVLYVTVESRTGARTTTLAAGSSGAEIRGSF